MQINFQSLYPHVDFPIYSTEGSAGFDLVLHNFKKKYNVGLPPYEFPKDSWTTGSYNYVHDVQLRPGDRILVGCGFAIAMPPGFVMDVRSRSGLALKEGLIVLNSPGTVDSDYRGEIGAILFNASFDTIRISVGDRIAQGVILKHEIAIFNAVKDLSATMRGSGGYGSTGKNSTQHY